MLLSKIYCLDLGFVAAISSHNDCQKLVDIANELMNPIQADKKMFSLASLTMLIKCPLFIQLHLSQFGFMILNTKNPDELEAYVPNETEICSPDLETSRLISDDMKRTTSALFINPKAYQADGCDKFISQVMTPINTYTTIVVHGSYHQWQRLVSQQGLPHPLEAYRSAVNQIILTEWNHDKIQRFKEQD